MAFVPIVLSLVVLAAHFLRAGCLPIALAVLALPALLGVRRLWVPRLLQVVLTLGAIEWIRTLVALAIQRSDQGEPYLRMALILGTVTAVTLASAFLFESAGLRRFYRAEREPGS